MDNGLYKIKIFCTTKEIVSKMNWTPTEWEKIFVQYTFVWYIRQRTDNQNIQAT
jgi:hypothetical protein